MQVSCVGISLCQSDQAGQDLFRLGILAQASELDCLLQEFLSIGFRIAGGPRSPSTKQ